MKLYKIYYKPDPDNIDQTLPVLYAFTDKKYLMKEFMDKRDNKKFVVITKEGESADAEYQELMHSYSNKKLKIILMKTKNYKEFKGYSKISVVGPNTEEVELMNTIEDFIIIFRNCFLFDPIFLKEEYKEAFSIMRYHTMYEWSKMQDGIPFSIPKDLMDTELERRLEIQEDMKKISFDEFEIYMMRYGGTFKDPS